MGPLAIKRTRMLDCRMFDPNDSPYKRSGGFGYMKFSRQEIYEIGVSVVVLTLAFAIVFSMWFPAIYDTALDNFIAWLMICAVVVLTGFVLHELGHKFAAQAYGAWAEYRMYPKGLALALIVAFFGFIFAAPGAVYIQGMINKRQNGIISVAGPSVNLVVGFLALSLAWAAGTGMVAFILLMLARVNLILALFNLIPFPPLDGSKVLAWNPVVYFLVAGVALVMFLATFSP